jgi:hypothetical protein
MGPCRIPSMRLARDHTQMRRHMMSEECRTVTRDVTGQSLRWWSPFPSGASRARSAPVLVDVVSKVERIEMMCNVGYRACVAPCHMREFISGVDYL